MDRLTVVGLIQDKEAVIEALMKLGAVEIDLTRPDAEKASAATVTEPAKLRANQLTSLTKESDSAQDSGSEYIERISRVQKHLSLVAGAISLLQALDTEKKPMFSGKRQVQSDRFSAIIEQEQDLLDTARLLEENKSRRSQIRTELGRLETRCALLKPWLTLSIDLEQMQTQTASFFMGSFDTPEQITAFEQFIREEAPETGYEVVSEDETGIRCIVYTWRQREPLIRSGLRRFGFDLLPYQGQKGTPAELYQQAQSQIESNENDLLIIENTSQACVDRLPDLEILHDYYLIEQDRLQAMSDLPVTEKTFWLEGWAPSHLTKDINQSLRTRFSVATASRRAEAGESFPIVMQNNRFVKSYEVIVEMFSPPSTKEIDPSPLLAPFFFFFFGMMLSDVGYGLMMSALCAFLLFKVKVTGEMARMSRMLFLSGISSMLWGLVFGGLFGDMLTVLSGERLVFPALWFNPMDDPTKLMIWSMIFGVLHLFAGMGAKAYMLIRGGRAQDAVLDIFPWYILLTGLGLMIGGIGGSFGQYMALGGAAVLILFGGRSAKNPIMRVLKGIMSLYGITGYFSDILSYTRILALVLATSVIAMVVNLLGFLLGPTPVGILVFILVAIFGHALNLALSALSAYVHTSRLHFVEFFSKFYDGGGRMWQPLRLKTKYIDIDRQQSVHKQEK